MEANGARIECHGPILMAADIGEFRNQLAAMAKTLKGEAALQPLESCLKITLRMQSRGRLETTVEITPDHMTQHHAFTLDADQAYLAALVESCDAILTRFPITNTAEMWMNDGSAWQTGGERPLLGRERSGRFWA